MNAKLIKIERKESKYGGVFFYLFFKDDNGNSYRTCVSPQMRNYVRWRPVLEKFLEFDEKEIWLKGLVLKDKNLVDADSLFVCEIKK